MLKAACLTHWDNDIILHIYVLERNFAFCPTVRQSAVGSQSANYIFPSVSTKSRSRAVWPTWLCEKKHMCISHLWSTHNMHTVQLLYMGLYVVCKWLIPANNIQTCLYCTALSRTALLHIKLHFVLVTCQYITSSCIMFRCTHAMWTNIRGCSM